MEASDSQLSDLIRQGRLNESQTENKTFDEFSQGTKQSIENGEYMLPELSQGGVSELDRLWESESLDPMRQILDEKPARDSFSQVRISSASLFAKVGKQADPKRRTHRIQDIEYEEDYHATEPLEHNNNHFINNSNRKEGSILDQATDMLNDSQDVSVNLLETSFESNLTVCQTQLDSQTKVDYMRKRTDEEQKLHNLMKKERRALERVKEEHYDQGYECMFPAPVDTSQMMSYMPQPDYEEKDIFAEEDDYPQVNVKSDMGESSGEQARITLKLDTKKLKKVSECVTTETAEGSYLWTKSECDIPLVAEWEVPMCFQNCQLSLKIRFVNYDKKIDINNAIMIPGTDVKKCREHIISEATGMPAESFFYVTSPDVVWKFPGKEKHSTGHFFRRTVPLGTTRNEFSIKFSCQEKCMHLTEKRKKMCLVVFLEDANGQVIALDYFKEVRIVAYPRRDYRNFCEKSTDHEKKLGNQEDLVSPVQHQFIRHSESTSVAYPYDMQNVTNTTEMFPSTSASRKRPAAADLFSHVTPSHSSLSSTRQYQTKLLLGDYGNEHVDQMDYESVNENYQMSSKRSRVNHIKFYNVVVYEEEIEDLTDFLAARAHRVCAESQSNDRRRHPLDLQKNIRLDTTILIWLTTFDQNSTLTCFEAYNIKTIDDLVTAYEDNSNVFESIGIPHRHLKLFYRMFYNFYRPYCCDRLKAEREGHTAHRL